MKQRRGHPRDRLFRDLFFAARLNGMDVEWSRAWACEIMLAGQGRAGLSEDPPQLAVRGVELPRVDEEELRPWER